MAYRDVEHGYFTPNQSDLPWTQSFRMTLRAPGFANRIFDTLAHAQAYIDDYSPKASAVPGIILVVISDTTPENNGVWEVLTVKTSSSASAGTMRRIDERTIFTVTNLTTDLEPYTTPGIYIFNNTTTNKGHIMFVELDNDTGSVIQTIINYDGYQTRHSEQVEVEGVTTTSWTIWTTKKYAVAGSITTNDVVMFDDNTKTLSSKIDDMMLMIYAGLA